MRQINAKLLISGLLLLGIILQARAAGTPTDVVSRVGDRSVVLHWTETSGTDQAGYRIYRSLTSDGPFEARNTRPTTALAFCDLTVSNGQTYYYRVATVTKTERESAPSTVVETHPHSFADDNDFLDFLQQTGFDYFWYEASPANGLVRDRNTPGSPASIAAVGFGLTAIGIAIDHGWITRAQGRERVLATLKTFWEKPQGTNACGTIGYRGWFYHFLDTETATRFIHFNTELSSIDTGLLLAGILYSKQFFNETNTDEITIRALADSIYNRVDWNWMTANGQTLRMGWQPASGFLGSSWTGYNEAMILYCLGLGATGNPLPHSAWDRWCSGYRWSTNCGFAFVHFPSLFGHQYSHCWIDFRQVADAYMGARGSTYFENSRRATLAQRAYCITNPLHWTGYGSNVWGLTACDGPTGYSARGAPPAGNDDGTIAPTAVAGSIPFAPEYSVAALRYLYDQYRTNIWTSYGFRDAFNLSAGWWGPDVLGIDQGPIVVMIENFRTQRVWRLFMQDKNVQQGLKRAGFVALPPLRPDSTPGL